MNIDIELTGADASEQTTLDLQDWIHRERIRDLRVKRKINLPEEGKMGIDPLTILTIVLGSKAVVELVKSIHVWIKSGKRKIKIKIKMDDKEVEIDAENIDDIDGIINQLT